MAFLLENPPFCEEGEPPDSQLRSALRAEKIQEFVFFLREAEFQQHV
jgi:hypothetical protein